MDPLTQFKPESYYHAGQAPMERRELRVAPEGLVEVHPDGVEVTTPWYEVRLARRRKGFAVLALAGRELGIDDRYGDWRRLADRVEALALYAARAPSGDALPPEQIAAWLGIPVDGALVCRPPLRRVWMAVTLGIVWAGVLALSGVRRDPFMALVVLPFYVLCIAAHLRGVDAITADVSGLTVRRGGRRRGYAWSDIESISSRGDGRNWSVCASDGKYAVDVTMRGAGVLAEAIRKVVAARQRGVAVPSEQPLPDGALSRMTGEDESTAERGLSRTE